MQISAKGALTIAFLWIAEEAFLNLMGVKAMIPEVVKVFVPIIGATAVTLASVGLMGLVRDLDRSIAKKIVADLEDFVSSGEAFFSGVKSKRIPRKESHRFSVLGKKYPKWTSITDKKGESSLTPISIFRASYCAEIFRAHGYIKGRIEIWKNRQKSSESKITPPSPDRGR